MAIRAYFCFWYQDGNRVTNPLMEVLGPNDVLPGHQWVSSHYPEAGTDGLPVKPFCMVIVKGVDFSLFDALPDVDKFPVLKLNTLVDDTPNRKQAAINILKNKYGVPLEKFKDCVTWKDVAHVILKYFDVNFKGFGNHIPDGDFG